MSIVLTQPHFRKIMQPNNHFNPLSGLGWCWPALGFELCGCWQHFKHFGIICCLLWGQRREKNPWNISTSAKLPTSPWCRYSRAESTWTINYHESLRSDNTYFFITKSIIKHMDPRRAAMIGPITHIIVASSLFLSTDTSGSTGTSGFGRFGGSPGGTSRMSRDRCSENGLDVYRCWNSHIHSMCSNFMGNINIIKSYEQWQEKKG